jgi:hypothetical protein
VAQILAGRYWFFPLPVSPVRRRDSRDDSNDSSYITLSVLLFLSEIRRRDAHPKGIHCRLFFSGSSLEDGPNLVANLAMSGEFSSKLSKVVSGWKSTIQQQEDSFFVRCIGGKFVDREASNDEFTSFTVDTTQSCLCDRDVFQTGVEGVVHVLTSLISLLSSDSSSRS